jgi:lipoprotein NlpI
MVDMLVGKKVDHLVVTLVVWKAVKMDPLSAAWMDLNSAGAMVARSVVLWVVKMGHSKVDHWGWRLVGWWVATMAELRAEPMVEWRADTMADALVVMLAS